jgi:hypothetical protein
LRRFGEECVRRPFRFSNIGLELGLRGVKQECAHSPNEISALNPELGLRDIPRQLAQRRRQSQRLWRTILFRSILHPSRDEVVRISPPPGLLFLSSPRRLAIGLATRTLTKADSGIRTKPTAANTTRSLRGIWHGQPSSPRHL